MSLLKQKTITGIFWSFIENFSGQGFNFIFGIILARLLTPKEFGLIGIVTIFIGISITFTNSGFGSALIRKKQCTETDYSTVFYYNLAIGILFFLILFFSAPFISQFFNEPQLKELVQILGFLIIIDAFTIIQRTILVKRIDFKLQTKISIVSYIFSGITGIIFAFWGFGVWSLVIKQISQQTINAILLWLFNRWRPKLLFSRNSFIELFSFGYKLLFSSLINNVYGNIYYLIIGKYFSAQDLGFYTRSKQFSDFFPTNIEGVISRVTFPVLSQIQEDKLKLKEGYKKIIKSIMLISFVFMIGMSAIAEPMIITLIGEKWRTSIIYLQMLCFVGMLYPLQSINLSMLEVFGRSDLFLKIEIIKKVLSIPIIIIGILYGIKIMIVGIMVNSLIAYYINSYWSGKYINYSIKEQISDLTPIFFLALLIGIVIFLIGLIIPYSYLIKFIVQVSLGVIIACVVLEIFKLDTYLDLKEIIFTKFRSIKIIKEYK